VTTPTRFEAFETLFVGLRFAEYPRTTSSLSPLEQRQVSCDVTPQKERKEHPGQPLASLLSPPPKRNRCRVMRDATLRRRGKERRTRRKRGDVKMTKEWKKTKSSLH